MPNVCHLYMIETSLVSKHTTKHTLLVLTCVQCSAAKPPEATAPWWKADVQRCWHNEVWGHHPWCYTQMGNSALITLVVAQTSAWKGWLPGPECPPSLSHVGLGILGNMQASVMWVPCTTENQLRPSDFLWVSQYSPNTSPWEAILLHSVGAPCLKCFCSCKPSPKLHFLPLYLHASGQCPRLFRSVQQSRFERKIIDHFWKSALKHFYCFQGRKSSRAPMHDQLYLLN